MKKTKTKTPAATERDYFTTSEAADLVGVKQVTVAAWCERGLLGSKFGPGRGRWRIRRADLERVAGKEWVPCHGCGAE